MLTTINVTFDHGQIILKEEPPVHSKTEVIVTFLIIANRLNSKQTILSC